MAAAYVQDKIDEEMIDAQIIDVVLYGRRFLENKNAVKDM